MQRADAVSVGSETGQEWLKRPERGAASVIRLAVWLALNLGRGASRLLLHPVCLYFLVFSARSRAASREYLAKALERPPGIADLYRHYLTFATCVLDRIFLLKGRLDDFDIRIAGEAAVDALLAQSRGCLLLGAHLGSFEVLRATGWEKPGARVALAVYEENARKIGAALNALNVERMVEIIALGQHDSMLKIQERLASGAFVGMLADRSLDGDAQIACRFLGDAARFGSGPFRIAAMLRAPILVMFGLYRGGRRYDVYFEPLVDFAETQPGERSAAVEAALRRYVARLEHFCRIAPYNWFNFYDFWK